jgi:peptidoglycan-associated lipoprotein
MRALVLVLFAGLLTGCATSPAQAPVDVAGRWTGTWLGYGVFLVPRAEDVTLDLVQGGTFGTGSLQMQGTLAADSVPDSIRDSGITPVRIAFDVSGPKVRLKHELGPELFEAELVVLGDRMVGQALRTDPAVRFDLKREKPQAASVPVAAAPSAPAPPPPPSVAPTPVTPSPPPVAEAPSTVTQPAESAPPPEPPRRSAPPPAEFSAVAEVRMIHFDFDRSEIRPADAAILDANADWLRASPDGLVLIEGHCDERGTAEYNLALGERRALATKAYLIGRGVADSRMTVTSYGLERPVCTEHTETCWARNRRASFLVKPR